MRNRFHLISTIFIFTTMAALGFYSAHPIDSAPVAASTPVHWPVDSDYSGLHATNQSSTASATDAQIQELMRRLPRLENDKTFFHWTKAEVGIRWILHGSIDPGEMDFYNTSTGDRQVYGAGLYLADSPTSSSNFGAFPVAFVVKKGALLYDQAVVKEVLGKDLTNQEITELGKQIPFVRDLKNNSGWFMTYRSENTTGVQYGGKFGAKLNLDKVQSFQDFMPLFEAGVQNGNGNDYLENLFFLTRYLDGISFLAAMETNPSRPQDVFEPEHFERFKQTYKALLPKVSYGGSAQLFRNTGSSMEFNDLKISNSNGSFGSAGMEKEEWAKYQINEVLPHIFRSLEGGGTNNPYRVEGIRAGGTETGGAFYAPTVSAGHLKMNPYLETHLEPAPGKRGFNVSYFYPDAFHFKHLKDKLSASLFAELNAKTEQELWADTATRQDLNNRIVRELLTGLFEKYFGKRIDYTDPASMQFLVDLVSIHPFPDKNGRSTRMYFDLAHLHSSKAPPLFPLSDFDTIMSTEFLSDHLQDASKINQEIFEEYLAEFLNASRESRVPDFAEHAKAFSQRPHAKIMAMFKSLGTLPSIDIRKSHFALIQNRKFDQVFTDWFGKDWEIADVGAVHEALEVFKDKPEIEQTIFSEVFDPNFLTALSEKQQLKLIQLASAKKFDLRFARILAEHARLNVVASLVPLVEEFVAQDPKVLNDPSLLVILKAISKTVNYGNGFFRLMFNDSIAESSAGRELRDFWVKGLTKDYVFNFEIFPLFFQSKWSAKPEATEFLIELAKLGTSNFASILHFSFKSMPPDFFAKPGSLRLLETIAAYSPAGDPGFSALLGAAINSAPSFAQSALHKIVLNRILNGAWAVADLQILMTSKGEFTLASQMDVRRVIQSAFAKGDTSLVGQVTVELMRHPDLLKQSFSWSVFLNVMRSHDPKLIDAVWSNAALLPPEFYQSRAADRAFEIAFQYGNENSKIHATYRLIHLLAAGEDAQGARFSQLFKLIPFDEPLVLQNTYPFLGQGSFLRGADSKVLLNQLMSSDGRATLVASGIDLASVATQITLTADLKDKDVTEMILNLARTDIVHFGEGILVALNQKMKEYPDFFIQVVDVAMQSASGGMRTLAMRYFDGAMLSAISPDPQIFYAMLSDAAASAEGADKIDRQLPTWQRLRPDILNWKDPRFAALIAKRFPSISTAQKAVLLFRVEGVGTSEVGSNLLADFIRSPAFAKTSSYGESLIFQHDQAGLASSPFYSRIVQAIAFSDNATVKAHFANDIRSMGHLDLTCHDIFVVK